MNQLKPTTSYIFSDQDKLFILELVKVGYVNILSHQVTLFVKADSNGSAYFSFKDNTGNSDKQCNGLIIPENWVIEHIGSYTEGISITFGVSKTEVKS